MRFRLKLKAGFVNSCTVLGLGPTLNCVEIGHLGFFFFFFYLIRSYLVYTLVLKHWSNALKGHPRRREATVHGPRDVIMSVFCESFLDLEFVGLLWQGHTIQCI